MLNPLPGSDMRMSDLQTTFTKERCAFGQDAPVWLLFGTALIIGAGAGFAFWHGVLGTIACSLLLLLGLLFALFPGHGIIHVMALLQVVTHRRKKRDK